LPVNRRLSPELIEALIKRQICRLKVLAAQTALDYARTKSDEAWQAFRSSDMDE
jgi:hypothetical protein